MFTATTDDVTLRSRWLRRLRNFTWAAVLIGVPALALGILSPWSAVSSLGVKSPDTGAWLLVDPPPSALAGKAQPLGRRIQAAKPAEEAALVAIQSARTRERLQALRTQEQVLSVTSALAQSSVPTPPVVVLGSLTLASSFASPSTGPDAPVLLGPMASALAGTGKPAIPAVQDSRDALAVRGVLGNNATPTAPGASERAARIASAFQTLQGAEAAYAAQQASASANLLRLAGLPKSGRPSIHR